MEVQNLDLGPTVTSEDDEVFLKEFGKRLAQLRKEGGLTQMQVAEILGCSQTQVAAFEAARRRIPIAYLPKLVKALGISFDELLGGTPSKELKTGTRLKSQLEKVSKLPRSKQKFVSEMLDGLLRQAS